MATRTIRQAMKQASPKNQPLGYAELIRRFNLQVIPPSTVSFLSGDRRTIEAGGQIQEFYPKRNAVGENVGGHLEFAIKHEGVNLGILKTVFEKTDQGDIADHIRTKPTGKYTRKLWFLHEYLTGSQLDIDDLKQCGYVDLLDMKTHYVGKGVPSRRHRVNDNLLGVRNFCPTIRRTPKLLDYESAKLDEKCRSVMNRYPDRVIERAMNYLFTKETRASFEIERVRPDKKRTARFVQLLKLAGSEDFLNEASLVELQRAIVDERFANSLYRADQNYVGESLTPLRERIHYVSPKPEDVRELMEGLIETFARMIAAEVHPVVEAAVVAFGFVFVHPFDDGNGRIHRFLIHHVLTKLGFTPEGMVFPVSATMLRQRRDYDKALETFSAGLMPLVEYEIDTEGRMEVKNKTSDFYRYIDMTSIAEYLFGIINETIETELVEEIEFLIHHAEAKESIQQVVDMPDQRINLFIQLCLRNQGKLSRGKRTSTFSELTDDEITEIEGCVVRGFKIEPN